jgi:hypothetical protein
MTSDGGYLFRPSIGVIASLARSIPSMQLTLIAATSVPSGFLPRALSSTDEPFRANSRRLFSKAGWSSYKSELRRAD